MSSKSTLSTPLIGQTETALKAILRRQLAGTDLSEDEWVALTLAIKLQDDALDDRNDLLAQVAEALKVDAPRADAVIDRLASAGLLDAAGSRLAASEVGRRLHSEIRAAIAEITQRLWRDLPPQELEIAGRVLGVVLARANAELRAA